MVCKTNSLYEGGCGARMVTPLRIGTRGSKLALWQANRVASLLRLAGVITDIVVVETEGDQDIHTPLWRMNGVGVFTAALDRALLEGVVDVAVHSYKDVPTRLADGISIVAVAERGAVHDVAIVKKWKQVMLVATSSRRRSAQWLQRRPGDLVVPLRGNIHKRLTLLADDVDAIVMAQAALERLSISLPNAEVLRWMVPAPAQGAICIAMRIDDERQSIVSTLDHAETRLATTMERSFLSGLDGGCSSAIGATVTTSASYVTMNAVVLSADGVERIDVEGTARRSDAMRLATNLIAQAINKGAATLVEKSRAA